MYYPQSYKLWTIYKVITQKSMQDSIKQAFLNMPCKPVPKSLEDLNFTEKKVLQDWEGGKLF